MLGAPGVLGRFGVAGVWCGWRLLARLAIAEQHGPLVAEQLGRVERPDGAVAAREIVSGTIPVTPPAHAFGMLRKENVGSHRTDQ
jgi:hypothetical protein